ncbi:YdcF family protein [Mycobacterium sp. 852002-51961_SCH5331710]|uniref:YdcF family protein n=1 Tax=Mycobacterium sp. 852002-51961_SCH5331710 TaxID=1834105 RepID=UPI001E4D7E14|nr:YdcF family protein [Mycobacterium sp. 852002-51961_SCH5331710]
MTVVRIAGRTRPVRLVRQLRRIAIAPALFLIGVLTLAVDIDTFSGRSDHAQADAAIVLGAAVDGDTPSPVFEERLRHAASLFDSGQVDWIILTGGIGQGDSLPEAEAGRNWLIAEGIPADHLLIETQSRTTRQNLAFAQPLLADHGIHRVLIVSDPLHMRRATRIAADVGLDAHPSPTPTSRFQTLHTRVPMLLREVYHSVHYFVTRQ